MDDLVAYHKGKQDFIGTPQQFVDELTYGSYRFNRITYPEHTPQSWHGIFPMWEQLEQRLMAERRRDEILRQQEV